MNDLFFVDTNIFIYARDLSQKEKQLHAKNWLDFLWHSKRGRISIQVLTEFFEVCRKKKIVKNLEDAQKEIVNLYSWKPISVSEKELNQAFIIRDENNFSWWDSLMLSSAISQKCAYFLSEDLNSGQVFNNLKIINPFELSPENIL